MDVVMRSGFRFFGTLVLLLPFVAAACAGDDDSVPSGDGTRAGASGSPAFAGAGGGGAARAGQGGTGGGDLFGDAGGGDACVPVGGTTNGNGVIEPLGDACSHFNCPATITEAAQRTLEYCGNTFTPTISYGCGRVTVNYSDFTGGTAYTFDVATDQVVFIRSGSDTSFGVCGVPQYFYGEFPEACPDELTCYPCDDLRDDSVANAGAPGAAGNTGAAGDTGAAGVAGVGGDGGATPRHCPKF
jgi:hypothetical protein